MGLAGSDRLRAVAKRTDRVHHQAAKLNDRNIARAEPFAGAIRDPAHCFPHRDVLVWDTVDPGEVPEIHRLAVLQVVVGARTHAVEVLVKIDADLRAAKVPERLLVDTPGAVTPRDEIKHRIVIVHRDAELYQAVVAIGRDQYR